MKLKKNRHRNKRVLIITEDQCVVFNARAKNAKKRSLIGVDLFSFFSSFANNDVLILDLNS